MKYLFIFSLLIFSCSLWGNSLFTLLDKVLLNKYTRPVTILYISNQPEIVSPSNKDVLVIWSNSDIWQICQSYKYKRVVVLNGIISDENMIHLSECEHFDIAILDIDSCISLNQNAHFADYLVCLSTQNISSFENIGFVNNKKVLLKNTPKNFLKKNWWKSCSEHKNYGIKSTFNEKKLLKPGEYSQDGIYKEIKWIPGINLYTFFHLNGTYPCKQYLREQVLEVFDPKICNDFGLGNIILQGKDLKVIDFDTNYGENPYDRLNKTIMRQMELID